MPCEVAGGCSGLVGRLQADRAGTAEAHGRRAVVYYAPPYPAAVAYAPAYSTYYAPPLVTTYPYANIQPFYNYYYYRPASAWAPPAQDVGRSAAAADAVYTGTGGDARTVLLRLVGEAILGVGSWALSWQRRLGLPRRRPRNHPGGMQAISPGSRSAPGGFGRPCASRPRRGRSMSRSMRAATPSGSGVHRQPVTPGALRDPGLIAATPPG